MSSTQQLAAHSTAKAIETMAAVANGLASSSATSAFPARRSSAIASATRPGNGLRRYSTASCDTSCSLGVGRRQINKEEAAANATRASIGWPIGPLHGGANQEVIEMLERIQADGGNVKKYVDLAKDKSSDFRLMGFGHRVYKNFDPRAKLIKTAADKILNKLGINDPLLDVAKQLEEAALKDSYFVERKLYPNVDFYSGIIYRALGFPTNMFTVLFAIGRLPGWIAHWKEMMEDPTTKIGRPRQIYTGATERPYVPIDQRKK